MNTDFQSNILMKRLGTSGSLPGGFLMLNLWSATGPLFLP